MQILAVRSSSGGMVVMVVLSVQVQFIFDVLADRVRRFIYTVAPQHRPAHDLHGLVRQYDM